jgi:homoserine O-acetyltransferase/O-succinyltransferase
VNSPVKQILIVLISFWFNYCFAQSGLHLVNIGDLTTTGGGIIKNCKIGYQTVGKLNADKSNIVLCPTWFTGTSDDVIKSGFLYSTIDTSGLYIIIVDALTNGVSSSLSNTPDFPTVSIRDMVNSQYTLLVNHLNINHLYLVMGMSMGGMQTFEWVVAYPEFIDKAIPIVGTPKQSIYDLLVWQTMADLIIEAGSNEHGTDIAMKRVYDILNMNASSPSYLIRTVSSDSINAFRNSNYTQMMNSKDYLAGLNAMIGHDIYKSSKCNPENIKKVVKADMLVIVAQQDHLVNPTSSISFSKVFDCELLILTGDCGHSSPFCESEKVKLATVSFLK